MKSKPSSAKTNPTTSGAGAKRQPTAPAVYRPQQLPKVLQTKIGRHQAAATPPLIPRPLRQQPNVPVNRAELIRNTTRPSPIRPNAVAQRKAAPAHAHNAPKPRQPFASRVAQLTQHVRVTRSQTLVKDCAGGKLAGTTFSWSSNFDVDIVDHKVLVTIRIVSNISKDKFNSIWRKSVADKWNNRFMIQANGENYPIVVDLQLVATGEHYAVKAVPEGRATGSGSRGHFGTESMTVWGENDVFHVGHEVGHMLGNVDEYGVVRLSPSDERDYLTTPSTGIMGKSEFDPLPRNYYLIEHFAKQEMIDKHIIKPHDRIELKADLMSRHGAVGDLGGPSLASVVSARGTLKPKAAVVTTTTTTTPPPSAAEAEFLEKMAARRRASMATSSTTPAWTTGPGGATSSGAPRALPPKPTAPTLAHKPSAVATAPTTSAAAHTPSASSSSPPSAASSPAKTASAPVKRAPKPVVIHTPPPPIPKINFHFKRVEFLDQYVMANIESMTEEQIAWFTSNPTWRTSSPKSEEAMEVLARGR